MNADRLFDVSGRHVLVTGGAKGIGAMITRGFHEARATVYVSGRSAADCRSLADELGERIVSLPADVSTQQGCRDLAAAVGEHTDRLDVLVNNAGTTWGADVEEYPDEAWDKVLALNVKAPFHLTAACLPMLRAASDADRPARVINIGSVDGMHVPVFESYAYSTSKAGVHQLTRHLGKRLAGEHVTVNAIAPGLVPSKMTKFLLAGDGEAQLSASVPLGRLARPDDLAGAAIFLASPAASWITGAVLPVDGGMVTLQ
ncbi:SDR family oxidoreductase [Gordonia humi]|uniref:NAD(P)-dependent dehydrogenase (Short-subunit alcohol dehydrogenase family) n=1 Tax=Gordonia humi TaxID=686429 RepID=A0A840EPW4_9ACTN|nr:SDR family oxidoreductase [Gordonia humi]MBB4133531.1 NAD(P)-dependent dehydrogenase (short-subunit alcohol dehydrogenase family) [Gordonia humi]